MFLGEKILKRRFVELNGESIPVHSETALDQCRYLQNLVFETKPSVTLETGLAFGISALFLCEALKKSGGKKHIAIDVFQSGEEWLNIGLKNITEAGFKDLFEFHQEYAHETLPRLHKNGVKIDFAYLDASKIFDVVLTNLYFIDLMLNVGGLIALDDCRFPGIRKVVKYWSNHPNYEIHSTYGAKFLRGPQCVTFRKVDNKERKWNWYQPF